MEPEPTKVCRCCGEARPLSRYKHNPSGRVRGRCVTCDVVAAKKRRHERRRGRLVVCRRCGAPKPQEEFPVGKRNSCTVCSDCRAAEAVMKSMKKHRRHRAPRVSEEQAEDGTVIRVSCGRFCRLCFGLPHRVRGEVCSSCGLKKGEAP
jgi:hypothetical protein